MPTAARLVAAVLIAIIAVAGASFYIPQLPDATPIRGLVPSAVIIGLICGWLILGRSVGRTYGSAMGNGISTCVAVAFWMLLLWALVEMIERSTKMRYDGPMEAVLGAVGLMVDYARLMVAPEVLGILLIGGIVAGLCTEWAARRWS